MQQIQRKAEGKKGSILDTQEERQLFDKIYRENAEVREAIQLGTEAKFAAQDAGFKSVSEFREAQIIANKGLGLNFYTTPSGQKIAFNEKGIGALQKQIESAGANVDVSKFPQFEFKEGTSISPSNQTISPNQQISNVLVKNIPTGTVISGNSQVGKTFTTDYGNAPSFISQVAPGLKPYVAKSLGYKTFEDVAVFGQPMWSAEKEVFPTKTITLPSGELAIVPKERAFSGYSTTGQALFQGKPLPYGADRYYEKYGVTSPFSNVGLITGQKIIPISEFKEVIREKVSPKQAVWNLDTGLATYERPQTFLGGLTEFGLNFIPESARGIAGTAIALKSLGYIGKMLPKTTAVAFGGAVGLPATERAIKAETSFERGEAVGEALLGFAPLAVMGGKVIKTRVWDYPAYNVKTGELVPVSDVYIKQEGVTASKKVQLPTGEKVDVVSVKAKLPNGNIEEVFVRAGDLKSSSESINVYRAVTRGTRPIYDFFGFEKPSFVGKGVEVKYKTNWGFDERVAKFSQEQYNKNIKELTNKYLKSDIISKDLSKETRIKQAKQMAKDFLKTTYPQDIISKANAEALVFSSPESFFFKGTGKDIFLKRTVELEPGTTLKSFGGTTRRYEFKVAGEKVKTIQAKEGYYTKEGRFVETKRKPIDDIGTTDVFKTFTERKDLWKKVGKQISREEGITLIRKDISKPTGMKGVIQIPGTKITMGIPERFSFERYSQFDISKDVTMPLRKGKISKSESAVNVFSYEPKTSIEFDYTTGKKVYRYKDNILAQRDLLFKQESATFFKRLGESGKKSSPEFIKSLYETPKPVDKLIPQSEVKGVVDIKPSVTFETTKLEGEGLPRMVGGTGLTELPKPSYSPEVSKSMDKTLAGAGAKLGELISPKSFANVKAPISTPTVTGLKSFGIYSPESKQVYKDNLDLRTSNATEEVIKEQLKIKIEQGFKIDEQLKQNFNTNINQRELQKVNEKLDLKIEQKLNQRMNQRLNQGIVTNVIGKVQPKTQPPKPRPPKSIITFPDASSFSSTKRKTQLIKGKKQLGSFDVYTRVKGKEVLVASRVTEQAGKDIGTAVTLFGNKKASALSASIILKPTSGLARQVQTRGEFARFGQAFRPGKRDSLTFVQKERTNILAGRLGTRQEKFAIKQSRNKGGMFSLK